MADQDWYTVMPMTEAQEQDARGDLTGLSQTLQ